MLWLSEKINETKIVRERKFTEQKEINRIKKTGVHCARYRY